MLCLDLERTTIFSKFVLKWSSDNISVFAYGYRRFCLYPVCNHRNSHKYSFLWNLYMTESTSPAHTHWYLEKQQQNNKLTESTTSSYLVEPFETEFTCNWKPLLHRRSNIKVSTLFDFPKGPVQLWHTKSFSKWILLVYRVHKHLQIQWICKPSWALNTS